MYINFRQKKAYPDHGTHIRWLLRNRCERKEKYVLFDLFKVFDNNKTCHKSDYFFSKRPIFLHACAICSGLPSSISTMIHMVTWFAYLQLCRQLHKNKSTLTTKGIYPALSFIFTKKSRLDPDPVQLNTRIRLYRFG